MLNTIVSRALYDGVHDLKDDPKTNSNYECMACGEIVTAKSRPNECASCGAMGSFQNRAYSLE